MRAPLAVVATAFALLIGCCLVVTPTINAANSAHILAQSQQRLVDDLAHATADSLGEVAVELSTAAKLYSINPDRTPADAVTAFAGSCPQARGVVLMAQGTSKPLARLGEPVPVESFPDRGIDRITVRVVHDQTGPAVVLTAAPVPGTDWIVVVSTGIQVPVSPTIRESAHAILLTTPDGRVVQSHGRPDPSTRELITSGSAAAADGAGVAVGDEGSGPVVNNARTTPLTVYAPVKTGTPASPVGLNVLLVAVAPVATDSQIPVPIDWTITLAAVVAAAMALIGFGFIRPIRRLRTSALTGVPSGRHRLREAERIAAALEGRPRDARRLRVPAWAVVLVAAMLPLGWAATVGIAAGQTTPTVPDVVVQGQRALADTAAQALRQQLSASLTTLQTFTTRVGKDMSSLRPALADLVAQNPRYRSVYVTDAAGAIQVSAGRTALRTEEPPPGGSGLHQQNTAGRVPVLFASNPLPDGTHTLVGELDVAKLSSVLRRTAGSARLVDSGMRTLAAADGYRAFDVVDEEPLRQNVTDALAGSARPGTVEIGGQWYVVASASLAGTSKTDPLRWTVLLRQPVTELPLPDNSVRNFWLFAAMAGGAFALALFGWYHWCFVGPLRRLAAAADLLAGGDLRTVIYPERLNEIGTVAQCLDACRRRRAASVD
ncbi:HAMP domain-containing protein [Kutzneria sp. CA-103260]|uniref:HAMP domain-containing protein n=1 Tax=Kutzneria sp. CA-103260 TaxID=2802641 RepID=UPI001BAAD6A6|nr:HAMP domain-containing protein [Kutzneria sp. CA-103260]